MDITEFLLARIAEDERAVHDVINRTHVSFIDGFRMTGQADRRDPARVLAECAAKRAIIEQAGKVNALEAEFTDYMWRGAEPEMNTPKLGDQILRTLAAVYSDHPDYRQEWSL